MPPHYCSIQDKLLGPMVVAFRQRVEQVAQAQCVMAPKCFTEVILRKIQDFTERRDLTGELVIVAEMKVGVE